MAFELKDGQGTLNKNDKGDNAKRPDYRGNLLIDGVLYKLSAWIKEGKNGKWMSLSASVDDEATPATSKRVAADGPSDDIPF